MAAETFFDYYYGDESTQFSFYRIPQQLITGKYFKHISVEAKLLYGLLLDRMGLSAKSGWHDKSGRVYIYYTLTEIQKNLNCGHDIPMQKQYCREFCKQHPGWEIIKEFSEKGVSGFSRLHAQLDQCFPGFAGVFSSLVNLSALSVLEQFPLPALILSASDQDIEDAILSVVTRKSAYLQKKVHALRQAAQNALPIAISPPSCAVIIKNLVSMLQILKKSTREVDLQIRTLIRSDAALRSDAELLKSIPGIADYAAAVILSEIGSVSSFRSAKQLVAFCGLDPTERQSGQFTGTRNKISKRGSKYLRCILNMSAHISVQPGCKGTYANPVLAEYFQRKRQSKPYKSALCAVMHKIVNIIFAVLRDQKPFELRSPDLHCQIMRERAAKLSLAA